MHLFPAIDVRGGRCVRLTQGDYDREKVYGDDPAAQAQLFEDQGAPWIHMVDLDAARTGDQTNLDAIAAAAAAVSVPVQVGGGVRTAAAAKRLFDVGVARIVIGTAAIKNPELVVELASDHRVAVGLDAWGSDVAVDGWEQRTGRNLYEVIESFEDSGVEALVVTEIARDGMMTGPDVEGLGRVLATTAIPIVASGGVGSLDDLDELAALESAGRRLTGAIVGRAIYEGAFSVAEAMERLNRGGSA